MQIQISTPVHCTDPDYLKAAMSEYHKKHFGLAQAQLEEAIKLNPKSQLAHYFMAQTLTELHDHKGALQEYKVCHQLDPLSSCGIKAKQGIDQYAALTQKQNSAVRENRRNTTKERLSTQIDKNVEDSIESNKILSKKTMDDAQKEADRIKEQAERDIDSLPRLRRNGFWRSQMRKQLQEQSKERIKDVMDRAKAQTKQMEKDTESKVETLESVKQGIHRGLQSAKKGTNIAPEGTNAYVRNYEHKK